MKKLRASSIIESMVVLMIITSGIVGVYSLMNSSQSLANATGNRIEAIQIARDGIEAMTNVRDTNWILFGADKQNCWNTLNYNGTCVGNVSTTTDIAISTTQGIRVSKAGDNRFFIGVQNHSGAANLSNPTYRTNFQVLKDSRGFYSQNTGSTFQPLFTREIRVDYLTTSGATGTSNEDRMKVTAIVQWQDPGDSNIKRLEMDTLLTNWKQ